MMTEEVHFYPGSGRMVYLVDQKVRAIADAWGGPAIKQRRKAGERMAAEPTTAGTYIIERLEAYRTDSWPMSQIAWGTPIRASRLDTRKLEYLSHRKWRRSTIMISEEVRDRRGHVKKKKRLLDVNDVARLNSLLRGSYGLPDTWLFSDFGPVAVRYYADRNKNRRLDAGESLSGQMIHTTQINEGQSEVFKGDPKKVPLTVSHGCIHIRPFDRDNFIRQGAFRKGMTLIVHPYGEIFDPKKYE
jgi:hypothetical protein